MYTVWKEKQYSDANHDSICKYLYFIALGIEYKGIKQIDILPRGSNYWISRECYNNTHMDKNFRRKQWWLILRTVFQRNCTCWHYFNIQVCVWFPSVISSITPATEAINFVMFDTLFQEMFDEISKTLRRLIGCTNIIDSIIRIRIANLFWVAIAIVWFSTVIYCTSFSVVLTV